MKTTTNDLNISTYIEDLHATIPAEKYAAAKTLIKIASEDPTQLQPFTKVFLDLLDSDNQILKWTAIDILGHIVASNYNKITSSTHRKLLQQLYSGKLITTNHAIAALAEIAYRNPDTRKEITKVLLSVEKQKLETSECDRIAVGKVILALKRFIPKTNDPEVLAFVKRQINCSRPATAKKAKEYLASMAIQDRLSLHQLPSRLHQ